MTSQSKAVAHGQQDPQMMLDPEILKHARQAVGDVLSSSPFTSIAAAG